MSRKKATPPNQLTDAHRDQFAACVTFWADVLGLGDWRITLSTKHPPKGSLADVMHMDLEQRAASIRLARDFDTEPVIERTLSDTALHEVLHILLHELKEFVRTDMSEDDILSAEHRVVNTLERVLSNASPLGPKR